MPSAIGIDLHSEDGNAVALMFEHNDSQPHCRPVIWLVPPILNGP